MIDAARKNYEKFLVPTNHVAANKVVRHYTKLDLADLDIKTSVNRIGEIVNLSQELNTMMWHRLNSGCLFAEIEELYCDISKLSVLSGIEIDKAKREYAVDSVAEIKRLRKKHETRDDDGRQVKPNFFGKIARMKGYYDSRSKNYQFHDTTMDYLQHSVNAYRMGYSCKTFIPFSDMLIDDDYTQHSVKYQQVDRILDLVRNMRAQIKSVWDSKDDGLDNKGKSLIVADIREECYSYIKSIQLSRHTAYRLLSAIEEPANRDISRSLFYVLFALPNQSFLDLIRESKTPIALLDEVEDGSGDVHIFGFNFHKTVTN